MFPKAFPKTFECAFLGPGMLERVGNFSLENQNFKQRPERIVFMLKASSFLHNQANAR